MDRLKTFAKYLVWIILFYVLSNFLIEVGINSMYKELKSGAIDVNISVVQAEATSVNGRIKGSVINQGADDINNKYIKIDFYSELDTKMGTKYIEILDVDRQESKPFEVYFKANNVVKYEIGIVSEKEEEEELKISFFGEDIETSRIILSAAILLLPMI